MHVGRTGANAKSGGNFACSNARVFNHELLDAFPRDVFRSHAFTCFLFRVIVFRIILLTGQGVLCNMVK